VAGVVVCGPAPAIHPRVVPVLSRIALANRGGGFGAVRVLHQSERALKLGQCCGPIVEKQHVRWDWPSFAVGTNEGGDLGAGVVGADAVHQVQARARWHCVDQFLHAPDYAG